MKILCSIVLSLCLWSCGNEVGKEKEPVVIRNEQQMEGTMQLADGPRQLDYKELNVVDFAAFEAKYLLKPAADTTYVINFWATWCKPCVKELPYFEALNTNYGNKNVHVILVSLDFPTHIQKQVIPFIKKHQLQSEILLLDDPDANTWIPKVSDQWSGAIPATLFIRGERRKFLEKSFTYAELETEVKAL